MHGNISGFWVYEDGGKIVIGYEDYNVEEIGGDFGMIYYFDRENSAKLTDALKKEHTGSLEDMTKAAFGRVFDDVKFRAFCQANGIRYTSSTWIN